MKDRVSKQERYLFRGKRCDNNAWETGSLIIERFKCSDARYIIAEKMTGYHIPVIPETIGQCTGLKDKNEKYIFEDDIIKTMRFGKWDGENVIYPAFDVYKVSFYNARICVENGNQVNPRCFTLSNCNDYCEIIGNIHENKL